MKDKIKLVIATNILDIGGAERTVQTLALYLNKDKFDVTILCMERGGSRVDLLQTECVRVLVGNGTLEKIKELIPEPDVDILHFHRSGQRENSLHEAVVEYLNPKKLMETNIFAFIDLVLNPRFDLQVFKSRMMLSERVWQGQERALEFCLKQRVIYNPVTVDYFEQFRLTAEQRIFLRSELGVAPDEIVIGRVGRNDTVKWGDLILSAIPEILKRNPNVKLLFRTVPTSRLRWLKKNDFFNQRVIVLPESKSEKDIAETYQIMDINVHTSRRGEAFGNSLNEAMVWSLPIIVENTPNWDNGQLEQVQNGKTGWVIKSVGGLISAVEDLLESSERRKVFGSAGRKKVSTDFVAERGVKQYELAYEQLAGVASTAEVFRQMYPTAQDLILFHKHYEALRQIDYPHKANSRLELKRLIEYWRWRIVDSMVSRGYIHL